MKHIYLDTNIYFDWIFRKYSFPFSVQIIQLCEDGKFLAFTNFITISTLTFFLQKQLSIDKTKNTLIKIMQFTNVIDATKEDAINCLNSNFNDLEDGYHYFSAVRMANIEAIVSRDNTGFKNSSIPILTPDEFLKKYS